MAIVWLSLSPVTAEQPRQTSARLQVGATVLRAAVVAWAPQGALVASAMPQGSNVTLDNGPVKQARTNVAESGADVRRFLTIEF
jgi:hypothetical protein